MVNKEIWCCVKKITVGKNYIEANSIGTRRFAENFYNKTKEKCHIMTITRSQALEELIKDILDHDDEGLKLGNWVRTLARLKLGKRLRMKI